MSSLRDAGSFLLLSVLWGTSFMAIKVGLASLPPVLFAAFRYDVAGVLMLAYAVSVTDDWRPVTREDWLTVTVGSVLVIALYNAFLFVGEQGVTSAVAAILIGMNPILTTAFSRVFLPEERLTALGGVGLLLGFLGVALVARPNPSNLLGAEAIFPGFVVLAAAAVALGSVLVQRIDSGIANEGMVAWSNALGALLLHAISAGLPSESLADAEVTTSGLVAVLYLAVFASALGYFLYFNLLDRLGAIEINLVSYTAPLFAALSGWVVLEETIDAVTVVGFVGIVLGFLLLKRHAIRQELDSVRSMLPSG